MAKKIYISPSNQNGNLYAAGNTNERDQCNRIAAALEVDLERNGYSVKRAPKGQDMNKSIRDSNEWGADIHIPIHTNAGGGAGPLVMVYSKANSNMKYAQPVYDALLKLSSGGKGYGVRVGTEMTAGNYMPSELSDTAAISVYIEAEFHDDKKLARWIIDNVEKIAEAIAKAICKADGKAYVGEKKIVSEAEKETDAFYRVQVGAFKNRANAQALSNRLEKDGYEDAFVVAVKK